MNEKKEQLQVMRLLIYSPQGDVRELPLGQGIATFC